MTGESVPPKKVTETAVRLRALFSRDPHFCGWRDQVVVNIEHERRNELQQMLLLDLADGTTIRLDVSRHTR